MRGCGGRDGLGQRCPWPGWGPPGCHPGFISGRPAAANDRGHEPARCRLMSPPRCAAGGSRWPRRPRPAPCHYPGPGARGNQIPRGCVGGAPLPLPPRWQVGDVREAAVPRAQVRAGGGGRGDRQPLDSLRAGHGAPRRPPLPHRLLQEGGAGERTAPSLSTQKIGEGAGGPPHAAPTPPSR